METPKEYKTECPGQFIKQHEPGKVRESDGTREVDWIVPDLRVAELMGKLMAAAQGEGDLSGDEVRTAAVVVAQYYHIMHLTESRQNKITRAIRVKIVAARIERIQRQGANSAIEFHGEIDRQIETENIEARAAKYRARKQEYNNDNQK